MPGGAVVTGNGIGANAPRNVWAGVLSVRLSLSPDALHILTTARAIDPLRRLRWYPLRLRHWCDLRHPNYEGLVVHLW